MTIRFSRALLMLGLCCAVGMKTGFSAPAWAQASNITADGHARVPNFGLGCVGGDGVNRPCGSAAVPLVVAAPASAPVAIGGSITIANTYQQIAASCPHGGLLENTSGVGGGSLLLDWTLPALPNAATVPGGGATTVGPAVSTGQAGGKQQIPPTSNPILVYGPAGASFRGSCF